MGCFSRVKPGEGALRDVNGVVAERAHNLKAASPDGAAGRPGEHVVPV